MDQTILIPTLPYYDQHLGHLRLAILHREKPNLTVRPIHGSLSRGTLYPKGLVLHQRYLPPFLMTPTHYCTFPGGSVGRCKGILQPSCVAGSADQVG